MEKRRRVAEKWKRRGERRLWYPRSQKRDLGHPATRDSVSLISLNYSDDTPLPRRASSFFRALFTSSSISDLLSPPNRSTNS